MTLKPPFSAALCVLFIFTTVIYSACTDPCKNINCANGGSCKDGICNCPTGYTGINCEKADPCKGVKCLNDGICTTGTCYCPTFYEGTTCELEVRSKYIKTYKGHGTDNEGNIYTNWHLIFTKDGTDAKKMLLEIQDENKDSFEKLQIVLQSNNTFIITQKTVGNEIINGSGTLSQVSATLNLTFTLGSDVFTLTFVNMVAQ